MKFITENKNVYVLNADKKTEITPELISSVAENLDKFVDCIQVMNEESGKQVRKTLLSACGSIMQRLSEDDGVN